MMETSAAIDAVGSVLPGVARDAIRAHVTGVPGPMRAAGQGNFGFGVFVTLRLRDGALRGCVGSLSAVEDDLVAETERVAVLAATRDPRFAPLTASELGAVDIEVSVVLPEEPVAAGGELDPERHGVVVRDAHGRRGVLLPGVPGVTSSREQLRIARRKAGIALEADIDIGRFEVKKFR